MKPVGPVSSIFMNLPAAEGSCRVPIDRIQSAATSRPPEDHSSECHAKVPGSRTPTSGKTPGNYRSDIGSHARFLPAHKECDDFRRLTRTPAIGQMWRTRDAHPPAHQK